MFFEDKISKKMVLKIIQKTFLKKIKKSVDKQKNILYNTNRSP